MLTKLGSELFNYPRLGQSSVYELGGQASHGIIVVERRKVAWSYLMGLSILSHNKRRWDYSV